MLYQPPAGYVDCEADAENDQERREAAGNSGGKYHALDIPGVGVIHARRPLPNAIPNLSGAANAKISPESRVDHLDRFILNHLADGEFSSILERMMDPDADPPLPPDTMLIVSRAIATAGTARPTLPSSHLR